MITVAETEKKSGYQSADAIAQNFDLFSVNPDYFIDPEPYRAALRDHSPIHQNRDGSVLLTRYADVVEIWRDTTGLVDKSEQFRGRFGDGPLLEHHTSTMLFRDPPDHDRLRAIVKPFFSNRSVVRLEEMIGRLVDQTLDEIADKGEFDFVSEFAFQIPIKVICNILGVPISDALTIHKMGQAILFPLNPNASREEITHGHKQAQAFKDYLAPHVGRTRAMSTIDPQENIICAMIAAERGGEKISDDEILHMCILMLNGGHETTTNLMGVATHYLLDAPDQLADLRQNPEVISTGIEELLRLVSPIQLQGRRTTRRVEISSGAVEADTEVVLSPGSANRDPRFFEDADRMNLRRRRNQHVTFGAGIHSCVGMPLARLEASTALPRFFGRFSSIERAGPHEFNRNLRFRGLRTLPLRAR
ncbi:cytochrome P450 [Novosphingopyxis sp.]|uniref:cytochrome P450 n=1 Tax=Novosphingopyxis sp. TaxID=2709690 RepID=UPI003B59BF92